MDGICLNLESNSIMTTRSEILKIRMPKEELSCGEIRTILEQLKKKRIPENGACIIMLKHEEITCIRKPEFKKEEKKGGNCLIPR